MDSGLQRRCDGNCLETTTTNSPTGLHGRGSWQHLKFRSSLSISDS